jgi:molybdate transport system substrate-binding protein
MRFKYPGKCRLWICFCTVLLVFTAFFSACHLSRHTSLTLSVAASLKDSMVEIEAAYKHGHPEMDFRNNFGSSGTLAQEIEQGAPADVFFSAALNPMDDLDAKGLVAPGSRHNLLRNTLVLIAPRDSHLQNFQGLTDHSIRLIALGDPASVPAGKYGMETLTALHLADQIKTKLVLAHDVRQVLTYVETGNADAGLVYATDAQVSHQVRIVSVAPEATHEPVIYPAAVVRSSHDEEAARKFIDYLSSPAAQAIFVKHGFTIATL